MEQYFKKFISISVCLVMALQLAAQDQQYFVYIQSERSQPFYVRYDGKLLSSSDKGYLIMSKLPAGTASLRVGFPKNDTPEQQFFVRLSGKKDLGFLLKQDADKGYALYNLQSYSVIKPNQQDKKEPVVADAAPTDVAGAVEDTETAVAAATPAAPVSDDTSKELMMSSLRKDLDSTFPDKTAVSVGPGTRPVRKSNKFSETLDKVVNDDRPEEILLEEPAKAVTVDAAAVAATPAVDVPVTAPSSRKGRRKNREREPLTAEEQQLLSDVLAEEQRAAAVEVTATDTTAQKEAAIEPAVTPEETTAPVVTEEVPEKKTKKQRKKKNNDPDFIDFENAGGQTPDAAGAPVAVTPVVPATDMPSPDVEEETPRAKKKKRKIIDTLDVAEHPNNVLTDSTGYAVSDLSIDHPRESRKERKRKKRDEAGADVDVAAGTGVETGAAAAGAAAAGVATEGSSEKRSSVKMINSDCGKTMDDATFRKVLRKFIGGKDEDEMIAAFRRYTKGYCLETSQIKTLTQLLESDAGRYRLLDQAYPKVYDSEDYISLESLLKDNYYKGRFKAMLRK